MSVTLGSFPFDLQLFNDADDAAAQAAASAKAISDKAIADKAAADAARNDLEFDVNNPKTYSEAHVKKIHAENANRRVRENELQTQLDARKDYDAIKADLEARKKKDLEDQGKFQEIAEAEKAERAKADKRAAKLEEDRRVDKVRVRIERASRTKGLVDTAANDLDLLDLGDLVKDGATPDDAAIGTFVEALSKSRPHWFQTAEQRGRQIAPGNDRGGAGSGGEKDFKNIDTHTPEGRRELNSAWDTIRL